MFCPKCGKPTQDVDNVCGYCGQPLKQAVQAPVNPEYPVNPVNPMNPVQAAPVPVQKPENVVAGIVGALLGALIGAAAIILLSMAGYVASISGLILAVCTFKGYELLGGRLTTKGIIISLILILVTPFLADTIGWGIVIYQEFSGYYDITFADAIAAIGPFIEEGAIEKSDYISNLVMLYGFTILGAFSSVWSHLKGNKKKAK